MSFNQIPKTAKAQPGAFRIDIPEEDVNDFYQLLKLSKIGPDSHEGRQDAAKFGTPREWLVKAKAEWEKFSWRDFEKKLNGYNHYKIPLTVESTTFEIHFVALFSNKQDAIPIVFNHGWPGSFLEFLPIIDILSKRYTPDDLPYHIVVPSLVGYAFSSKTPLDRDFHPREAAAFVDKLMTTLGLDGYLAQGGDIGSRISRILGVNYDACKAVHLNFVPLGEPESVSKDYTEREKAGLERLKWFLEIGSAYRSEHATRPSTIGLALSASPLALASWIGEKFLTWVDEPLPLTTILESLTLYWFTQSFSTSIYPYRADYGGAANDWGFRIAKPFGYSSFPKELYPVPKSWVETSAESGKLDHYSEHETGGHFAALEKPEVLLKDVEDFVKLVWQK